MMNTTEITISNAAPSAFKSAIRQATRLVGACAGRFVGNVKVATWGGQAPLPGAISITETVNGDGSITIIYSGPDALASDILEGSL